MLIPHELRPRAQIARMDAQSFLIKMGSKDFNSYRSLAELLGNTLYSKENSLTAVMTIDDMRLCEALVGPHGYAIYRMLLARKQDVVVVEEQVKDD